MLDIQTTLIYRPTMKSSTAFIVFLIGALALDVYFYTQIREYKNKIKLETRQKRVSENEYLQYYQNLGILDLNDKFNKLYVPDDSSEGSWFVRDNTQGCEYDLPEQQD